MRSTLTSSLLASLLIMFANGCFTECSYQGQCAGGEYCAPEGFCEPIPGGGNEGGGGGGATDPGTTTDPGGTTNPGGTGTGGTGIGGGGGSRQCGGELDTFNDDDIVLMGTISEGSCGAVAVATINNPWDFGYGLHCHINRAFVRPSDGAVLYTRSGYDDFYVYNANPRGWDEDLERCRYLDNPGIDDDDAIVASACPDSLLVSSWLLAPDTSQPIYQCSNDGSDIWYDLDGQIVFVATTWEDVHRVGTSGRLLVTDRVEDTVTIVDTHDETRQTVTLPHDEGSWTLRAARVRPGGFYALFEETLSDTFVLYEITYDGEATEVATLDTSEDAIVGYNTTLDASGNVYSMRTATSDEVFKFDTSGAGSVAYTEDDQPGPDDDRPYVLMHGSFIFSGP